MTITVKKIALAEQIDSVEGELISENYLGLIADVTVACSVRVGTLNISIGDLHQLKQGKTFVLDQKTPEPVDLFGKGYFFYSNGHNELAICTDLLVRISPISTAQRLCCCCFSNIGVRNG